MNEYLKQKIKKYDSIQDGEQIYEQIDLLKKLR